MRNLEQLIRDAESSLGDFEMTAREMAYILTREDCDRYLNISLLVREHDTFMGHRIVIVPEPLHFGLA
jgi:hypothetical protein